MKWEMSSPTKPAICKYTTMENQQLMKKDRKRRKKEERNYKTARKQLIRWCQ